MKWTWAFVLLFSLMGLCGYSQSVDSLLLQIKNEKEDSVKLRLYIEITEICDIPEIEIYANKAIQLADSLLTDSEGSSEMLFNKGTAYNNLAFMYHEFGDLNAAEQRYQKSLQIYQSINDSIGIARTYNNVSMVQKDMGRIDDALESLKKARIYCKGKNEYEVLNGILINLSTVYVNKGDYKNGLKYAYEGLELQEKNNDQRGKGHTYNTLATIYYTQKDYQKAKEYFEKTIRLREEINDVWGLTSSYNNLGFVLDFLEEDSLALGYYNKSLELRQKLGDKIGISESYSNLGSYYLDHQDSIKGVEFLLRSIKIREAIGDVEALSNVYHKVAIIYLDKKQYKKAINYGEKALQFAENTGYPSDIKTSAAALSVIYEKTGKYKQALEMNRLFQKMKDSLFNKETQKAMIQNEVNYQYEKQKFADSLQQSKADEIVVLEMARKNAEIEKGNTLSFALSIGVFLLVVLAIIILIAYRNKRKSVQVINQKKEEIELQKTLLEEKNKEITDSLNYASRIQKAILTSDNYLKEIFPNHFVLFKPKEIVSGDFYWAYKTPCNKLIWVVADCTGHGVPGAFMSMVGNSLLNETIIENKLVHADEIVNKLRQGIINILQQKGEEGEQKDGMDLALCILDMEKRELEFCGANNGLYLIRKKELKEFKPNKMPVGHYAEMRPFASQKIKLEKNDVIYTFSDGFADQFGGVRGKKYKYKPFKELLLSNQTKSLEAQKETIDQEFETWRGDLEQIDDVCVIGVRV